MCQAIRKRRSGFSARTSSRRCGAAWTWTSRPSSSFTASPSLRAVARSKSSRKSSPPSPFRAMRRRLRPSWSRVTRSATRSGLTAGLRTTAVARSMMSFQVAVYGEKVGIQRLLGREGARLGEEAERDAGLLSGQKTPAEVSLLDLSVQVSPQARACLDDVDELVALLRDRRGPTWSTVAGLELPLEKVCE